MRRLISTVDLPKAEWLKIRKTGITGTDAGAIVGLNCLGALNAVNSTITAQVVPET